MALQLYTAALGDRDNESHSLLLNSRQLDLLPRRQPNVREPLQQTNNGICCLVEAKVHSKTHPWSAVERQESPFRVDGVIIERHTFLPSLGSEQLCVHAVKVGSSVHGVDAVRNRGAFGDEDWVVQVRAASHGEYGVPDCFSRVDWDGRI